MKQNEESLLYIMQSLNCIKTGTGLLNVHKTIQDIYKIMNEIENKTLKG